MFKKLFWAALAVSAVFATGAQAQEKAVLKWAVFTPEQELTFVRVMKPFAEKVMADAQGTLEIQMYPNGALGRDPTKQLKMVQDGVADIAWIIASYTPGRFQENEVFELPGMFRDLQEATTVFTRLVLAGKVRGYDEFHLIGLFGTAPYSLHARNPIASIKDIKGKKIRSSGAIEGETLKALGAVPIGMPVTEVPEAISRGTVDGTTSHPSPLFDFGIARVTNSHFFTRLGVVPLAILMNKKKFDSLPKAGQDAIRKYSGEWTAARFNTGIGEYNASLVKQLQADPKRKVVFPSQQELDAMQPAFRSVIEAWAAKSPRNKELLGHVQAELATLRGGK